MRSFVRGAARVALALLVVLGYAFGGLPRGARAADCQFVLGFRGLHDMIPAIVGDCLVDEHHDPDNGDALQETTGVNGNGGLLVWRKADNFTAYTDGTTSWVNGPYGLQRRPNSERFSWEGQPPSGSTPDATAPVLVGPVTAIGDSVMLGAAAELARRIDGVEVDATVSRQAYSTIDLLRTRRDSGRLAAVVVVHIGNNGTFTSSQFDEMMSILAGATRVVFVNLRVPRSWEGPDNAVLADGVQRYPNAVLADWRAASAGRPELFWGDGIHLRPEGARAYAGLIVSCLQGL